MQSDLIKKHFEKSMKNYDQNATVQNLMASKMVFELAKISKNFENILELGSGTGLLTKKISKEINFKIIIRTADTTSGESKIIIYLKLYISIFNFWT